MNKTIEITVDTEGKSCIETKGFSGNECQQSSRFLLKALGVQEQEQFKSEFYSQSTEVNRQHESQ